MVKRHFRTKVLSTAIALTIATVFSFGTTVMAAGNTDTQVKHQEPVRITDIEPLGDPLPCRSQSEEYNHCNN